MRRILFQLWNDERGSMSTEWALVATVLVLGAVTGAILTQAMEPSTDPIPALHTLR
jgi:Flp pilus assembly pilin Flp